MKKIVVIYKTKYGSTKRYAEWIAKELDAPIFDAASVNPSKLAEYDIVIYGGGLYSNGIIGVKLVTENPCKTLIVFTVGLADPDDTDYTKILNKNFKQDIMSQIKFFHLRGGINYAELGFIHKGMMAMLKKQIARNTEEELSSEDREFLRTYGSKIDFTNKSTIQPIIDYVHML